MNATLCCLPPLSLAAAAAVCVTVPPPCYGMCQVLLVLTLDHTLRRVGRHIHEGARRGGSDRRAEGGGASASAQTGAAAAARTKD